MGTSTRTVNTGDMTPTVYIKKANVEFDLFFILFPNIKKTKPPCLMA